MKNNIYIVFLGFVVSLFACTDLEEEPIGLLAPEAFFKTNADVETAVLGAYGGITHEQIYGRKLVLSLLLRGDMADIGNRGTPGRRQQVNDFNMDSNNGMITAFWPRSYRVIGAINASIAGAELLRTDSPSDELDALEGEARFLRAFMYYHLVRIFGDIPYIDFFITDPAAVATISKTAEAEVYQNIITDLEFAKTNLPDTQEGGLRSRPSKGTAAAYLASVHLTLGNNQQAYDEAKFVIDNKGAFDYALMADFAELYDAASSTTGGLAEHVFMIDYLGGVFQSENNSDWMGPVMGISGASLGDANGGWSVAVPTLQVFESWDERDYRRDVSMIDSAFVDGELVGYDQFAPNFNSSRPHIGKFWGNCGPNAASQCQRSDINFPAMRYAEVLLTAAEAADNLGGKETEAIGYIDELRARARNWAGTVTDFPAPVDVASEGGDLTEIIREERRLELAFEYKRWYDIKRWNIGDEVFKGVNSLEPHDNFDASRDYYFPLPQDELDRNVNLMPQNPGY